MRTQLIAAAGFLAMMTVSATPGHAAAVVQTLGTADYANGQTVGTGTFAANPSHDPAPFDTLIGNKSTGPNPSTSFTFSVYGGPIANPISAATLAIGLYDAASPDPATEVQFFSVNGIDLAGTLTSALEGNPARRSIETSYTLNLPSSAFSALATGSSTFALGFQGPGVGLLGPSNFILFGLDFATLTINAGAAPPAVVPEPPAILLMLTALCGLGALGLLSSGSGRSPAGR